jgi:hypothetical protein
MVRQWEMLPNLSSLSLETVNPIQECHPKTFFSDDNEI